MSDDLEEFHFNNRTMRSILLCILLFLALLAVWFFFRDDVTSYSQPKGEPKSDTCSCP